MPEGPEVKNLVIWLNKNFKYKKILNIKINSGKYKKNPKTLSNKIFPQTIESINCKGKFIYFIFKNSNYVLFVTLGMTGLFILYEEKHNNIEFNIEKTKLFFNDFRNFGNIIISNKEELTKKLNTLGADILNENDNFNIFNKRINRKRDDTYIASALLDQKVSAIVGNYIRVGSLYLAKISPYRKIKDINNYELKQIGFFYYNEKLGRKLGIINGKYILINKFKKTGTSIYKPEDGKFLVYRQDFDPKGNKVIHEKINNRTIHYVKKIQK